MSSRVVVLGSINVDLFARVERHPEPGETLLGQGGTRAPGGKGANQALAAALQGGDVALIGAVGSDGDAATALSLLRDAGVDLTGVTAETDAVTGLAIITVSAAGENTIVVISGANFAVDEQRAEAAAATLGLGDVLLLQGELPRATTQAAARAARAAGHRVVLNVAPWGELDADVLLGADPLVLNEHEARLAVGSLGGAAPAADADAGAVEEAAAWLVSRGAGSAVITLGGAGAVVAEPSGVQTIAGRSVTAVDTTGAGDAFCGALAARLAAGVSLLDAARHANRVGAYVVQREGAQPSYPALNDLETP